MKVILPQAVQQVYHTLLRGGFEVYFVGGCVRDLLLERPVKDWDMTTNAQPDEMLKLFPDAFYDNQFGTVGVLISAIIPSETEASHAEDGEQGEKDSSTTLHSAQNDKLIVEITTYRTERDYKDGRHPTEVVWGKTIQEDLERRDFTMNAIAMKLEESNDKNTSVILVSETHPESQDASSSEAASIHATLVDPYNGRKDIADNIIRAVGNPNERFKEDGLRLMRAIRFATQLQFTIEENTWKAILEDAKLLPMISGERIRDELLKMLGSDYPYEGIMLLKNAGLLQYILPELLEGIGVSQERPGRHHTTDVFTHNVMALKLTPATDPIVRLATLIHDAGKPRVQGTDTEGFVIFYNHEIMGAQMAYEIANRLHLSKKDRKKIVTLIRWHMFTVDEHITDSAVRRFIRRIGVENVNDMIDLRIGDRLGSGTQTAESWRLKLFKDRIEKELAPGPFSINDLAIDGNDIMQELNIPPSRKIGELLQKLFEEVDENLELNTRDYLLKRVKELAI